jgi:DNA repair protein RadC
MTEHNHGHRARLRERFTKVQTDGLHEYEVLELLLTYAIPRRDVKPIAKNLLVILGWVNGAGRALQGQPRFANSARPGEREQLRGGAA